MVSEDVVVVLQMCLLYNKKDVSNWYQYPTLQYTLPKEGLMTLSCSTGGLQKKLSKIISDSSMS